MSVRTSDGERLVVMSMRAARFGDGLLVHWRHHDAERRLRSHLDRVQRVGDAGWMEWNLTSGQVTWSPAAYRILHRDPAHGAIKLASLPRYVAAEDAAALTAAIQRLTRSRQPLDCTVRLQRGGVPSVVRLVADPVVAGSGRVVAVHGAVHLISGDRAAQAGARRPA
jgi:PAS domain-containing protein